MIQACDKALEKRNELIQLQANRIDQLKNQNDEFAAAIVKLSHEADDALDSKITWGVIGLLVGGLAGALLNK